MNNRKWIKGIVCLLVAVLMIAGVYAATVEYGGQSDPLVTLSYINDILLPASQKEIDTKASQAQAQYAQALEQAKAETLQYIDRQLRESSNQKLDPATLDQITAAVQVQLGSLQQGAGASWAVVKIPAGKTVSCSVGCQMILRIGKAVCVAGGTPGLLDLSNGETLAGGKSLSANHLYQASIQNRGFSTAEGCTVLICGDYILS